MFLRMKDIVKTFGPVKAVKGVSLEVDSGEIHGLLGENGAGKSTLMNILAGVLQPTSGEIYVEGELKTDLTPKKTAELGIRFIHQELNLFNHLRVFENLFLSEEITKKFGVLDKKEMIKKSQAVFDLIEINIDPLAVVETLEASKKQLVEIAKSLLFDCKLIIMDEPTASLNNGEIEALFKIMRKLKDEGVSFIYISHKMPELFSICNKYTVLRDGTFIETGFFKDIDEHKAAELLVGKTLINEEVVKDTPKGDVLLEAKNITSEGNFSNISFTLRKGEILAVTGLQGDGKGELAESLFGARKLDAGELLFENKKITAKSIKGFIDIGIGMVPRNRKERSIIKDLSILDNLSISTFVSRHKNPMISKKVEYDRFLKNKKITNIKTDTPTNLITSLSGGNQQKVIISRWIELETPILILDNPTQGIDIGAKAEIYNLINQLAREGKSIIVFSSEFPEIYKIADRCLVMYKGEITAELNRENLTEVNVMYYATGGVQKAT